MPVLGRMLTAPLFIDVRAGAISGLTRLLAEWNVAPADRVAFAVGPGQGDSICNDLKIGIEQVLRVPDGSFATSVELGQQLRLGRFKAVAGIGGGLFVLQKRSQQKNVTTEASAQSSPAPRQIYEHDWAKHSLDTTHSVIQKIRQQRKEDDLKDAVGRR